MKTRFRVLSLLLVMLLTVSFPVVLAEEDPIVITLIESSDLHGCIASYDYATDTPTANTGLGRIAAYVKEQRAVDPDLILVDNGDALQGNMISLFNDDEVHPMVAAFNLMDYDVWNLGNHEFNYDFSVITRAVEHFGGDVLLGNAYNADGTGMAGTQPYVILTVKGVKIGIFGATAPHIDRWEASDPTHYNHMTFISPLEQTEKMVAELRSQVDILVGLIHYGREGEYDTAGVTEIADQFPQVDAFLAGHSHEVLSESPENGAAVVEPGSNGVYASKVTFTLSQTADGYKIIDTAPETVAMAEYEPDPELLAAMQYVHHFSVEDANIVIGQISADFLPAVYFLPGIPTAQIQDTALVDLINTVQLHYTGADVSLAALFDAASDLKAGDFRKKDSVNVYKYDNTLMAVKVTGEQLKAVMEQYAGAYFNEYRPGDVTISFNPSIRLYNYDMFAGVDYEIDISKPVGERIVNLVYKGEPLEPDTELILALNNYRYGALLSSGFISADGLVFDSTIQLADTPAVRDLISVYVVEMGGVLDPVCDHNWRIVGADLEDPAKDLIYDMIRSGEIAIPISEDGRTPNVQSINANDLREEGIIPAELDPAA
jgi:2',3'-cyclic-nucleotide 2'-phosphodiesterase (5'-nucleotidase family)